MPAVALFLGVGLLGERLTAGAIAGLILIAIGAWLATGPRDVSAQQAGGGDVHYRRTHAPRPVRKRLKKIKICPNGPWCYGLGQEVTQCRRSASRSRWSRACRS